MRRTTLSRARGGMAIDLGPIKKSRFDILYLHDLNYCGWQYGVCSTSGICEYNWNESVQFSGTVVSRDDKLCLNMSHMFAYAEWVCR